MGRQLFFAMSSTGARQVDRDTAIPVAQIDERLNITSRGFVGTEKTIEEIFDCIGEEVVDREVTRIIRRVTIELPYNPPVAARFIAYAKGVAAAPTGATLNKRVELTVTGTGGYFILTLPAYDGYGAQPTVPIALPLSLPALKYAVGDLDNVGHGNAEVSDLGGGVIRIEFVGKRAAANLPTLTIDASNVTGGTVTVASSQAGAQKAHVITENPGYQNYYASFVMGFEDEPGSETHIIGAQVEAVRVNAPEGNGAMTMSVDIVARDLAPAVGFVVPPCVTPRPMRLSDCRAIHGGVDITPSLIDFSWAFVNNTVTDTPAYTGRGVKPSRLERGRRRARTFNFRLLGGLTQALRLEAATNPEAKIRRATSLRMGTEGENVTENVPNNLLTVDLGAGGGLDFQTTTEDSINRYVSAFDKVGVTPPSNSVANVSQAVAFLLPPA